MNATGQAAVDVTLDFTSAGVNRVVNALDWGPFNLIAYASHNTVVVYSVEEAKILSTLKGHGAPVTCVKWINATGDDAWLLSGSADCAIRCWHWNTTKLGSPWTCTAELQGHLAAVSSLCLHNLAPNRVLLTSTAGEQRVLVWEGNCGTECGGWEWVLVQQLQAGGGEGKACVPLCTAVSHAPGKQDWLVLAVGGTDMAVRLYVRAPGAQFEMGCKLLGAESWVRALAFTLTSSANGRGEALLLASACQDRYLRVWVVEEEGASGSVASATSPAVSRITRFASKPALKAGDTRYIVSLEGVLLGHEDWVHSVCWQHTHSSFSAAATVGAATYQQRSDLHLLSASMDRTMILWAFDSRSQLWMNQSSVGDAGATCLGYYGGVFSPDGTNIVAHGFTGALHLWSWDPSRRQWAARHALGGHWAPITDCSWGADGKCVFTVSADQTARVFSSVNGHWCEMARPQVHGHDLRCVACIPFNKVGEADSSGSYVYASGSEEKVIRVFEAPQAFLDTLAMARGGTLNATAAGSLGDKRSLGAALPALGLSNKAVYQHGAGALNGGVGSGMDGGSYTEGPDFVPCASPSAVAGPPLEEHLAQNTLWPEVHKLYGHGNDLFCLAADPLGRFVASACVAKTAASANIWVWGTQPWRSACERPGHTLTVTQMEFSHDGQFLLSGSRDRSFCIFRVGETSDGIEGSTVRNANLFQLATSYKRAHARVIYGVSWSPDDRIFATCSRDQTIKFWSLQIAAELSTNTSPALGVALLHTLQLDKNVLASPSAVAFAPLSFPSSGRDHRRYLLAVGNERGGISVHECMWDTNASSLECNQLWESSAHTSHAATITRLRWRLVHPKDQTHGDTSITNHEGRTELQLASSSSDHSLRIFTIVVKL